MKYNKKALIQNIQKGEEEVLLYYYDYYHKPFFGWARNKFSGFNYQEIEDIYNETWIIIHNNIQQQGKIYLEGEKIIGLWGSVFGYLKGIARLLFLEGYRSKKKRQDADYFYSPTQTSEEDFLNEQLMFSAFGQLKLRWKRLLYYRLIMQLEYAFIAKILPAKSGDVVKTEKSRAQKKLIALFKTLKEKVA